MKKTSIYFLMIAQVAFISGCKKFLEENPKSIASPQTVLSSVQGLDAALVGAYSYFTGWSKMYSWDVLKLNESLVDFQYAPQAPDFSNGNVLSTDYPVNFAWSNLYSIINSANTVLANISAIANDPNKNRIDGEAKFLRGWSYFYLVQLFGDVPLVLSPVNDPAAFQPTRTAQADVYNQIVSDLTDAENEMNDAAPQPSRVNKWVAKAYLAKVYLTMAGNPNNLTTYNGSNTYTLALNKAKEIISSGRYDIHIPYQSVFLTTGDAETIWEILCPATQANYNHFTFLSQAIFTPTDAFINSFDARDVRGRAWGIRNSYVLNGTTYNFPLPTYMKFVDSVQYAKGQQFQSGLSVTAIRLADVYLMAAEADNEAGGGPSSDAYGWINAVRERAGIPDLTAGLSQSVFRDSLFIERRKELYGEGFDWFDLKRFNKFSLLNTTGRTFVTAIDDHLNYFPIYSAETISNPNVKQNAGWPG
ncbi:MAG: RagB/SusD family nutrient uptake outer membrane protein [Bacteroidota bacterium]|nr:RagB/SusD family nutrient uptake outer membrane protein [Bacteroidota bacterium]MDP4252105.1 RagB/SusD family nutrient uptake outer membrane protein [Bacteroidota bacterium]